MCAVIITKAMEGLCAFDVADQIDARAVRQHEIAQDDVRLAALNRRPGLRHRRRRLDLPPLLLEHDAEEVAERRFVVDDEQVHTRILARATGKLEPLA